VALLGFGTVPKVSRRRQSGGMVVGSQFEAHTKEVEFAKKVVTRFTVECHRKCQTHSKVSLEIILDRARKI
jgi:hypothetical protein